jgi:hypothetical protein
MFLGEMLCMVPVIMQYLRHRHRLHKTASTYTLVTQVDEEEEHRFVNSDRNSENESLSPKMTASGHIPPPTISGFAMCWLFFPALFDILGTTLMNVGLILVPVSIYQMSRGALVLWVGVLSVMFLSRRLRAYQWAALIIVVIGVGIVGLSGSLVKKAVTDDGDQLYVVAVHGVKEVLKRAFSPGIVATQATKVEDDDPAKVLVGVLFILFAQVFTASQFVSVSSISPRQTTIVIITPLAFQVIEEKIMTWYSVEPLVRRESKCQTLQGLSIDLPLSFACSLLSALRVSSGSGLSSWPCRSFTDSSRRPHHTSTSPEDITRQSITRSFSCSAE